MPSPQVCTGGLSGPSPSARPRRAHRSRLSSCSNRSATPPMAAACCNRVNPTWARGRARRCPQSRPLGRFLGSSTHRHPAPHRAAWGSSARDVCSARQPCRRPTMFADIFCLSTWPTAPSERVDSRDSSTRQRSASGSRSSRYRRAHHVGAVICAWRDGERRLTSRERHVRGPSICARCAHRAAGKEEGARPRSPQIENQRRTP